MRMLTGNMTIQDIAGFCPEEAVWKMMADVSDYLLKETADVIITPDSIVIDGDRFMVETVSKPIKEFLAPEQSDANKSGASQMIWSIGAVAYYAATGHVVFGGHGGSYQKEHPSVSLPVLPKGLQSLTQILHKSLCYKPEERVGLKELNGFAQEGLLMCSQQKRMKKEPAKDQVKRKEVKYDGEKWPEEMIVV